MSVACKFERSILSHEEYEAIRLTHHPAIYSVEVAELEAMRPACARCATRSERSAAKSNERAAERPRLAARAFREPPSMLRSVSRCSRQR